LPGRQFINVLGAGVASVVDNPGNNSTDITLSGGGSSGGQYNVTLANGVNSNVNTNGHQSVIRVGGPTAAFSIDGFDHAPAAGEVITVINTTAFTMSAGTTTGSTAGQRVQVVGGTTAATQVRPGGAMQFTGDSTSSVWVLTSLGHYRASEINVQDWGADPTGVNDGAPAIQAAINYAQANLGQTVYIPAGSYLLLSPLFVTSQVRIRGDGNAFTTLTGYPTWCGPFFAVGGNTTNAPVLVTSGSISMLELTSGCRIDLQKACILGMTAGTNYLNGVTNLEVGCYLNPLGSTLPAFITTVIVSSSSQSDEGDHAALDFFILGGGSGGNFVQISMTVSVGATTSTQVLSLTSPTTLPLNTTTFVSFSYDGTSLKLYQNGLLVGTATGTSGSHIVANEKENFCIGFAQGPFPMGGYVYKITNPFLIGELFFNQGTFNYSAPYTPPTGPLSAPAFGYLMSFTTARQSTLNNRWFYATFTYPVNPSTKVWWVYEDGNVIQITNVVLSGMTLNGPTYNPVLGSMTQQGLGINLIGVWFSTFHDLNIQYLSHGVCQNINCVNNTFDAIFVNSMQGAGFYSNASFASEYTNCNVQYAYYGCLFQASGNVVRQFRGSIIFFCFIYDTSSNGATLTSEYLDVVYDDETAGCLKQCLIYFAYKNSTAWRWGSVYIAPGGNTPPQTVKLIACTNMLFENTLFGAPTGGYVFSFSQPDNYAGTANGQYSHIPPRVINQILGVTNWIDPANPGELILDGQETSGMTVLNFASDADMSIGLNDLLFHTIVLTDTAGVLTTGRNAKLPAQWLRERVIINRTAQTITILGASIPAWTSTTAYKAATNIAAAFYPALNGGVNASIVKNSGNVYMCATAIASATTAPTTAIYGKVVTDGSGSWQCFGAISAPTVAAGARIEILSDGVQWA